ncbi:kinase-like domain-containing protein [Jimgerdemannia flammicorona]|uniref:Kinase-like domain-containing protein n=1 Tax=Jimgerdemannia flammicorona TaxID=994334 RepID=A0A433QRI9_9FUNG|nr:kinase-like domain-containing protein [Jimgerdemannia flammicorona]
MSVPKLDHWVDGVPTYYSNPEDFYDGLSAEIPTWTSELGDVYYCREAAGARQTVVIRKYLTNEQNYVPNNFGISTELVENEIFTMAKCALHPNILRLHSIYIYNGYVFLVTPFCDGGTLYHHCLDNCVALPQMVFILKRHGYIHRDIKSENVFLGKDNAVMLAPISATTSSTTFLAVGNVDRPHLRIAFPPWGSVDWQHLLHAIPHRPIGHQWNARCIQRISHPRGVTAVVHGPQLR